MRFCITLRLRAHHLASVEPLDAWPELVMTPWGELQNPRIACVGEAMIELSIDTANPGRAAIDVAGDTLNTAIYLKRALDARGIEATIGYASCVGDDAFSDRILDRLHEESIATDFMGQAASHSPGLYAISTDETGERSFSYWRDRSAARQLFQAEQRPALAEFDSVDVLYLSSITLAILPAAVRQTLLGYISEWQRTSNHFFAFDSNFRPRLWESIDEARATTTAAARLSDLYLPSIDDLCELYACDEGAAMQALAQLGRPLCVVKRGVRGPVALQAGALHEVTQEYASAQEIVDATAAGDSFNGALLAALLAGDTIDAAMLAGHRQASAVVGHRGAIMPRSA